jgi:hypothetical protein
MTPLAGRQPLPALHPPNESVLRIADRSPDLDVGRPIAPHSRLGKPRDAAPEDLGGFFGCEQLDGRRDRLRRRRAAGERRRGHFSRSSRLAINAPQAIPATSRQQSEDSGNAPDWTGDNFSYFCAICPRGDAVSVCGRSASTFLLFRQNTASRLAL